MSGPVEQPSEQARALAAWNDATNLLLFHKVLHTAHRVTVVRMLLRTACRQFAPFAAAGQDYLQGLTVRGTIRNDAAFARVCCRAQERCSELAQACRQQSEAA